MAHPLVAWNLVAFRQSISTNADRLKRKRFKPGTKRTERTRKVTGEEISAECSKFEVCAINWKKQSSN